MQRYVVGFDIADVRNLKPEGEGTCDPFVVVQCCGKTYRTQVRENKRLHVPINESMIWNDIELNEEKFETAFIEFSVFARNFWWRDYLIGKASLQLWSVNRRKAHIYFKKTVPLRKENDPESTGSITLTVWCLIPTESAPTASQMADAAAGDEEDGKQEFDVDLTKAVLGDQELAQSAARYHLIINIFRVEDLPKIKGSYPSPFVTVEFAGACRPTEDAHNTAQYTFNREMRIPVQAPICEDVILIKLWTKGSLLTLSPDLLLAQGLISFSELRNNALQPTWFCLYGWDPDEVDMDEITRSGERILPNFFKGRLLISGRVERIREDEELKEANTGTAQPAVEPEMRPVALLADVYQVCGAVGKECQVRLNFGARQTETHAWAVASRRQAHDPGFEKASLAQALENDKGEVDTSKSQQEDMVTFQFTQKQGRIPPLTDMTPEDPASQPYIMVNIYTRGIMSGELRVGYQRKRLADFPKYEVGWPSKPRFIAMEPMPNPFSMKNRITASVLMTIEHHTTDDVQRHDRRNVKPMPYIVRAYVFMARNIATDDERAYAVRVTCAGVSKSTAASDEVRPMWMKCLELPIMLCSDHPKEQPTAFPITVTLCHQRPFLTQTRDTDIGKTVCVYEYMRRRDNMGAWEPFSLNPQWVQLNGGTYGSKVMGEALIAFELVHARDRTVPECAPRPLWPAKSENDFDDQVDFSYLRKATLHVAMFGVRDLKLKKPPASMDPEKDLAPMVEVRVKHFRKDGSHGEQQREKAEPELKEDEGEEEAVDLADDGKAAAKPPHLEGIDDDTENCLRLGFKYREAVEGGDKDNKDDRLMYWHSDALCEKNNLNYEIFQTKKKKILLPDKVLLQPFISIRVLERPTTFKEFSSTKSWLTGKFEKNDWRTVGEYRESLSELYPCKWLHELYGTSSEHPTADERAAVVRRAREELAAKPRFEEESLEERAEAIRKERLRKFHVEDQEKIPEAIDTAAWPLALRLARDSKKREASIPMYSRNLHVLNMHRGASFKPRCGEKTHAKDRTQAVLSDKMESRKNKGRNTFNPDFHFANRPLLRNHDLINLDDETVDWNYFPKDCYGFVKCAIKLTDGWGEEDEEVRAIASGPQHVAPLEHAAESHDEQLELAALAPAEEATVEENKEHTALMEKVLAEKAKREKRLWNSSHGLSEELEEFAFGSDDPKRFARRFKGSQHLPSRVRVRIYFVKAICIMGKPGSQDPYLRFTLGKAFDVSMRNVFQPKTSTPSFYRVEERDIRMPEDGRLQVDLWDYEDAQDMVGPMGQTVFPEKLIGSTTIDLEDRWHSREWQLCAARKTIPPEQRPLYNPEMPGRNCGSIEMWVEMLDSMRASEEKATNLRKPPEEQVEVRIVIWTCTEVPLLDGSGADMYSDVAVSVKLECNQYRGEEIRFPREQETDIHNHCTTGNAVFNYRIVFPRITVPTESCTLDITLKEMDALSEQPIGQITLDIRKYVEKVGRDMESVHSKADLKIRPIDADDADPPKPGEEDGADAKHTGRVQLEMWVLTQEEAKEKEAGMGRNPPNDHPPLTMPAEGRGWNDVFAGVSFELPSFGLFWKVVPLILFTLLCIVAARYLGLLGPT